jgi:vitamin B12 transporter
MRKSLFCSVIILPLASAAFAAPETVVVSATRSPQPLEVTGVSVSVITADDLEYRQTVAAGDALAGSPGLTVVRNGGMGQNTNVLMRGAEAGQTLVLVDGVRINDPSATTGFALLGDVLVNGIDRIEVLRGPQSTLYGSDAIGGVVNILTLRGGDTPFALRAEAEGGSFDTLRLNLATNGTYGSVEYGAAANAYVSNSISAADARDGNGEPDGYRHFGATANLRWHVTGEMSFDARLYYTRARDSFDGYAPPTYSFQDTHQYGTNELLAAYGGVNFTLFDGRLANRLAVTRTGSDRKTFDPALGPDTDFFAEGGNTRFEYQGVFKLDEANEATFGAESQRTSLATQSVYDPSAIGGSDRINGVYAQWQTRLWDSLTLTGGVRYDDDREFGGRTSLKLAAAWQALDGTTLRANYGDGFKAPSLYQLFSPYSNPLEKLRPETASGWEAGIDQRFSRVQVSLTYFERRTSNQIDFFSCWGASSPACDLRAAQGGYYYNVKRSRAKGIEAEIEVRLTEALSVSLNYTNLTDVDLASGLQLARRPNDSANAFVMLRALPNLTLGLGANYTGSRFDDAYHFTPLEAAVRIDALAACKLNETWELFGRVENLTDERAEPVAGYGAPGRAFYAGIQTRV